MLWITTKNFEIDLYKQHVFDLQFNCVTRANQYVWSKLPQPGWFRCIKSYWNSLFWKEKDHEEAVWSAEGGKTGLWLYPVGHSSIRHMLRRYLQDVCWKIWKLQRKRDGRLGKSIRKQLINAHPHETLPDSGKVFKSVVLYNCSTPLSSHLLTFPEKEKKGLLIWANRQTVLSFWNGSGSRTATGIWNTGTIHITWISKPGRTGSRLSDSLNWVRGATWTAKCVMSTWILNSCRDAR